MVGADRLGDGRKTVASEERGQARLDLFNESWAGEDQRGVELH
jgi:hypothetical protein